MLFSVWPADVLLIALAGDQSAMYWMPEPLQMWRRIEEGNMAAPVLDELIGPLDEDVMLAAAAPHTPLDVILPSQPPTYEEAVSSNAIDLISYDEGDGGDYDHDDDCVFVN